VWHAPGRNPLAGDHRGVDAILATSPRRWSSPGTFRSKLHDIVANNDHAVSLFVARGQREGKTLEARNVLVTRYDLKLWIGPLHEGATYPPA
jgi:uncharacterized protein